MIKIGPSFNNISPGMSLVELLIGVAVMVTLAVLIVAFFLSQSRLFSNQKAGIHVASQNRLALDEITNQIRESQSVIDDCTTQLSNCPTGEVSNSLQLIIATWPIDSNGNAYQDDAICGFDYIVYKRGADPTKLVKEVYPDTSSSRDQSVDILSSDVTNLAFAYNETNPYDSTEVTITLKNETSSLNKTHDFEQETKASLRNIGQPAPPTEITFPYAWHTEKAQVLMDCGPGGFPHCFDIFGDVGAGTGITDFSGFNDSTTVHGDVYSDWISPPLAFDIMGTLFPASQANPLPNIDLNYWETEAGNGTLYTTTLVIDEQLPTFGPARSTRSILIQDTDSDGVCGTTITGTIYTEMDFILDPPCDITLAESFGPNGTLIIAEDDLLVGGNVDISKTSQGGYILFVKTTNPLGLGLRITHSDIANKQASFYNFVDNSNSKLISDFTGSATIIFEGALMSTYTLDIRSGSGEIEWRPPSNFDFVPDPTGGSVSSSTCLP